MGAENEQDPSDLQKHLTEMFESFGERPDGESVSGGSPTGDLFEGINKSLQQESGKLHEQSAPDVHWVDSSPADESLPVGDQVAAADTSGVIPIPDKPDAAPVAASSMKVPIPDKISMASSGTSTGGAMGKMSPRDDDLGFLVTGGGSPGPLGDPGVGDPSEDEVLEYGEKLSARKSRYQAKEATKRGERKERLGKGAADDTWTGKTNTDMDLSDAVNVGSRDPEKNDQRAMDDFTNTARTHQLRTTELLRTMQGILIEAITDIEALQAHFNRLR